ncbi:MAG: hypothetical protein HY231_15150 [Acidobacteria bacterium]|nr:hypothetical protein [Acidobacteriota bacterium]
MEIDFENPGTFRLIHGGATEVVEELLLTPAELIRRCSLRPVDTLAWSEFVRRFSPTIRVSIEQSLQLQETQGELNLPNQEAMMATLMRRVYVKLTEQRCLALRQLEVTNIAGLKVFLQMVALRVVREFLRHQE